MTDSEEKKDPAEMAKKDEQAEPPVADSGEKEKPAKKAKKKRKKKAATGAGKGTSKTKKPRRRTGKSVVIVESPAKARTINKILGNKYVVKACMGHIRDLPKSKLAIDIDNNFEPTYRNIRSKAKIIKELKIATKKAAKVYLAPRSRPRRRGHRVAPGAGAGAPGGDGGAGHVQ